MRCPIDPTRLAPVALLLGLSACVQPPLAPPAAVPAPVAPAPAAPAPAVPPPAAPTPPPLPQRLQAFHERTRSLPPAEWLREQARLAVAGDPASTLELAWLLGQGRNPGDLARALALLDPLARGDGSEAPLARLLQARLAEQRRLEEQLERLNQQQRDLQRRNDQLREQLEALRDIERSLGPRPPASAPRSP